jgi:hypothetical protein
MNKENVSIIKYSPNWWLVLAQAFSIYSIFIKINAQMYLEHHAK